MGAIRNLITYVGAPVFMALGGVMGIVLTALLELRGAGIVSYGVAVPWGLFIASAVALWDKALALEEQRQKYLPRVTAARILRVPFNITATSYGRTVVVGNAVAFNVIWVNNPAESSPDAKGRDMRAYISVFRNGTQVMSDVPGRWDDTPQPEPMKPTAHLAALDLGIGEARGMALVVKFHDDRAPYLFTNVSYGEAQLKKPDYRLDGDAFTATVRVRGTNVDAVAELEITTGATVSDEPMVRIIETKHHVSEPSAKTF